MRVFVALELSDDIKDELFQIQSRIAVLSPLGNYTDRGNFHLTLKFIGEVDEVRLPEIYGCIDRVASMSAGFSVMFSEVGAFTRGRRSIVYARVAGSKDLSLLYESMEHCLVEAGFVRADRVFRPHITLGRNVLVENLSCLERVFCGRIVFRVDSLCLMESRRVDGVLRYVPLYRVPLGSKRD